MYQYEADGLASLVVRSNEFETARHYADYCVATNEKEISVAALRLTEGEKMLVEGCGVSGLAALLPGRKLDRSDLIDKKVAALLCGGDIDMTILGRALELALEADNRLVRFIETALDHPGGIFNLTNTLSKNGSSVKDMHYERAWLCSNVDQTQVKVVMELQRK